MKSWLKRVFLTGCFIGMAYWRMGSNAYAETMQPEDSTSFGSDYYADGYLDLKQAFGDDLDALLNYLNDKEGWSVSIKTETETVNVPLEVPSEQASSEAAEVPAEPAKLPSTSSSASGDAQKDAQARIIAQQIADSCTGETDLERIRQAAKMVDTNYMKRMEFIRPMIRTTGAPTVCSVKVYILAQGPPGLWGWYWNVWGMNGCTRILIRTRTSGVLS